MKDQFGHPLSPKIRQVMNSHMIPWSPEAFDDLIKNFSYWTIDKDDPEEDFFKKKRMEIHPKVTRLHLTKTYIAQSSIAPDRVAERPILFVPNWDDFRYLSWDKLYELNQDTRVSKLGELRRTPHPETLKILKQMGKEPSKAGQ